MLDLARFVESRVDRRSQAAVSAKRGKVEHHAHRRDESVL
jgi:hypothetical protein